MGNRRDDRPSSSSKSKRDKERRSRSPRRDRETGSRGNSSRSEDNSSKKEKDVQRGIEHAKNRLKSSLNSAISDFSTREAGSSDAYPRRIANEIRTNFTDSIARQAQIELIEEPGFKPASFKSDADSARAKKFSLLDKKSQQEESQADYDRALFGPMWASLEKRFDRIEKRQAAAAKQQQSSQTVRSEVPAQPEPASRFPLAHENLSEDPEVRQQRWLNLWRERRRMAMEGAL